MSAIIEAKTVPDLRAVLAEIGDTKLADEEIAHMFGVCEALWYYRRPASADRPHVILRDETKHSDFFVNCLDAIKEPLVLTACAKQLIMRTSSYYLKWLGPDDWIIGTERAGAPICQEMARLLGCRYATVEKDDRGNPTVFKRFEMAGGRHVLLVNDLLSHDNGSTYMSVVAVHEAWPEAEILPVALHLVNRSGKKTLADGRTIVQALLEYEAREYPADNCELCKGGSPAKKFKANKAEFFAA